MGMSATSGDDLYQVLGVGADASAEAIRRAYRTRARSVHPDVRPGEETAFKRVTAAYEVLGDVARRRAYDRSRVTPSFAPNVSGPSAARRAPNPSGNVPPTRRPTRVVVDARQVVIPGPVATTSSSTDEWRSAGLLLRAIAVVLIVAVLGVAALLLTGTGRGPGDPPAEQPFCKTPDGWVDCRVIDPFSQY
jgi:hypothetical protein